LRFILALVVELLTLAQALSRVGWLHPWLLPERRSLHIHWVGERRQPLRPVHFLPYVFLAETILILFAARLSPSSAFTFGLIGNLVIVALAMLPSTLKRPRSATHQIS
jgi:hypothetical protein